MKYVVNFSTGLSSYWSAKRTIERYGVENTIIIFCDVRGDPQRDPHAAAAGSNFDGEDNDNYRFLDDCRRLLGADILRLSHPDGLGVWGAIFKRRAISIVGAGISFAPCTTLLKMEVADHFIAGLAGPITQVLGLGWKETSRIEKFKRSRPGAVWFPMAEPPYVENCDIIQSLAQQGVNPPRSYGMGYPHSNCGGACIKAGQKQWAALLEDNPGRYAYNEFQEDLFRRDINPNVSILRDYRGPKSGPLPLGVFRREIEAGLRKPKADDWAGCACYAVQPDGAE